MGHGLSGVLHLRDLGLPEADHRKPTAALLPEGGRLPRERRAEPQREAHGEVPPRALRHRAPLDGDGLPLHHGRLHLRRRHAHHEPHVHHLRLDERAPLHRRHVLRDVRALQPDRGHLCGEHHRERAGGRQPPPRDARPGAPARGPEARRGPLQGRLRRGRRAPARGHQEREEPKLFELAHVVRRHEAPGSQHGCVGPHRHQDNTRRHEPAPQDE
mmetsp:Transcript_24756/g.73634  ORF Transcript_24756/g.73634 Transcript_24756/m.73634 type:complete len:215 (-) Transcript_24756:97-741(-)